MPLYEYECTACHKRTEKIQKFSDPEITICPKCGGVLERVISAPAIAFKGGGWYADGYGNAKPNPKAGGSSEGGGSDASTGSTSADSKSSSDAPAAAASSAAPAATPAPTAPSSPVPSKS